jgi:hypothetical protein
MRSPADCCRFGRSCRHHRILARVSDHNQDKYNFQERLATGLKITARRAHSFQIDVTFASLLI